VPHQKLVEVQPVKNIPTSEPGRADKGGKVLPFSKQPEEKKPAGKLTPEEVLKSFNRYPRQSHQVKIGPDLEEYLI
jgi:hypothetical protein